MSTPESLEHQRWWQLRKFRRMLMKLLLQTVESYWLKHPLNLQPFGVLNARYQSTKAVMLSVRSLRLMVSPVLTRATVVVLSKYFALSWYLKTLSRVTHPVTSAKGHRCMSVVDRQSSFFFSRPVYHTGCRNCAGRRLISKLAP